ncbi:hypothetical protein Pst134EA_031604 [Puccinia striiformis f. sp. tritici]|uniref:uncharacterized protein n=1 Tax=Puccinia striiformis f. sp. tritici TaxID=168172 RepID=UPI002008696E|nr:uncharacterized protein Pst134EA_031604 [Puccinia striiformis f. sp. tritici]KAH9442727.1 hypothetical protein Pst134EA_031604 [Puccinia striiformis f. sp. tritici]
MDDTAVTPLVANRRLPPPSYVTLCTRHLKPPVLYLGGFTQAHQLYLQQQAQVIKNRFLDLACLDVWVTKSSHVAFIGIACCYINKGWKYVCEHLAPQVHLLAPQQHQEGIKLVLFLDRVEEEVELLTQEPDRSITWACEYHCSFQSMISKINLEAQELIDSNNKFTDILPSFTLMKGKL